MERTKINVFTRFSILGLLTLGFLLSCIQLSSKEGSLLENCDTLFYENGSVKKIVECENGTKHGWTYHYKKDSSVLFIEYFNNGILRDKLEFGQKKHSSLFLVNSDTVIKEIQSHKRYSFFSSDDVIQFVIDYGDLSNPRKLTGSSISKISLEKLEKVGDDYNISLMLEFAEPPYLDYEIYYKIKNDSCKPDMEILRSYSFDRTIKLVDLRLSGCSGEHIITANHIIKSTADETIYSYLDSIAFDIN